MAIKLQKFSKTTDIIIKHPVSGVELEHEDGRKLSVTVYSTESIEYADAVNRSADRVSRVNFKKLNSEEKREYTIMLLADCIKSFNNFDGVDLGDGEVDPSDKKGILRSYKWLRDQIDDEMGDLGNFIVNDSGSKKKD